MIKVSHLLAILQRGTAGYHKIALYSGLFDGEAYTKVGEVTGQGYTVGGKEVVPVYGTTSKSAFVTYSEPVVWKNSTIAARSALIYEVNSGAALHILDFGSQLTSTNASFTLEPSSDPLITWSNQ